MVLKTDTQRVQLAASVSSWLNQTFREWTSDGKSVYAYLKDLSVSGSEV